MVACDGRWRLWVMWIVIVLAGCSSTKGVTEGPGEAPPDTGSLAGQPSTLPESIADDEFFPGDLEDASGSVRRLEDERVPDDVIRIDKGGEVARARPEDRRAPLARLQSPEDAFTFQDIYFDFDRWAIPAPMMRRLHAQAEWLKAHADTGVIIEGHCDARGSREYNMVLGEKRALSVKHFLVKSGVNRDKISVISYGKERLSCFDGVERCHAQNRRAHLDLR